jgi:hypothetical protein
MRCDAMRCDAMMRAVRITDGADLLFLEPAHCAGAAKDVLTRRLRSCSRGERKTMRRAACGMRQPKTDMRYDEKQTAGIARRIKELCAAYRDGHPDEIGADGAHEARQSCQQRLLYQLLYLIEWAHPSRARAGQVQQQLRRNARWKKLKTVPFGVK